MTKPWPIAGETWETEILTRASSRQRPWSPRLLEKSRESRGENQQEAWSMRRKRRMEAPGRGCSILQDGRGLSRSLQEESGSADTQLSLAPKADLLLTFVSSNCTISFFVCDVCAHTHTCMLTCTNGSRGSTTVLFHPLLRGRFIDLELSMQSRLAEQWAPGSRLPLTACTGMTITHFIPRLLTRLGASCKNCTNWAISP